MIEEVRWIAVIFEESANAAVLLDNPRRIFVREFRYQVIFAVGRRMEEKGEQMISLQPSGPLVPDGKSCGELGW